MYSCRSHSVRLSSEFLASGSQVNCKLFVTLNRYRWLDFFHLGSLDFSKNFLYAPNKSFRSNRDWISGFNSGFISLSGDATEMVWKNLIKCFNAFRRTHFLSPLSISSREVYIIIPVGCDNLPLAACLISNAVIAIPMMPE